MNSSREIVDLLERLFAGADLDRHQAQRLIVGAATGVIPVSQVAALVTVYRMRQLTLSELIGFREGIFSLAKKIDLGDFEAIDVCGTGGDGKSSYNVSTAVAFVLAGAGIRVAKHGNHGVSSACGSSTVLEKLGVSFSADEKVLRGHLERAGLCFLHAPLFHPALKSLAMLRKELGFRTFLNIMGPLLNPASVTTQLIGVYSLELARLLKYYFQERAGNVAVVYAADGYDEVSLSAPTHLLSVGNDEVLTAESFELSSIDPEQLCSRNGSEENAAALLALLENRGDSAYRSVVLANSAVALRLKFPARSLTDLVAQAAESLDSGRAREALKLLVSS